MKTTADKCSNGTPNKKANHKMMQITGIFGPSVNHNLIAATQNTAKASDPYINRHCLWANGN